MIYVIYCILKGGDKMKRKPFRTTLKEETIKQLKKIAAEELKDMNEILEKMIKEKYEKQVK